MLKQTTQPTAKLPDNENPAEDHKASQTKEVKSKMKKPQDTQTLSLLQDEVNALGAADLPVGGARTAER